MCIAILKLKDTILDRDTLKTCAENNPDGCGYAYVDNGKIHINKFMKFDDFWKSFDEVQRNHVMLIHFRIATHGEVNLYNCHPFKLNNRMALIHNGIISDFGSKKENKSDTRDYIEKVIGKISYKMWNNPAFRDMVGRDISSSKFVILKDDESYFIINESKGHWGDGAWYSNYSYEKPKVKKVVAEDCKQKTHKDYIYNPYQSYPTEIEYIGMCKECGEMITFSAWWEDECPCCNGKLMCIGYRRGKEEYYYNWFKNSNKKDNKVIEVK